MLLRVSPSLADRVNMILREPSQRNPMVPMTRCHYRVTSRILDNPIIIGGFYNLPHQRGGPAITIPGPSTDDIDHVAEMIDQFPYITCEEIVRTTMVPTEILYLMSYEICIPRRPNQPPIGQLCDQVYCLYLGWYADTERFDWEECDLRDQERSGGVEASSTTTEYDDVMRMADEIEYAPESPQYNP